MSKGENLVPTIMLNRTDFIQSIGKYFLQDNLVGEIFPPNLRLRILLKLTAWV